MRATTNLVLDIAIAAAFLVSMNPPLVGLPIHEWLGLGFAAALVAHLVLHYEWMVAATKRLFTRQGRGRRLNYAVDAFLLVALTATVLSGLMISRHVLAALALPSQPSSAWREIHSLAANASVAAVGLHLGLHWDWIALNVPRLATLIRRTTGRASARERKPSATGVSCPSTAR